MLIRTSELPLMEPMFYAFFFKTIGQSKSELNVQWGVLEGNEAEKNVIICCLRLFFPWIL